MLVWVSIFAVLIALGRLCSQTPLGGLINRAVLDGWSALTSGRARTGRKVLFALGAVLVFAVLGRGTPFIFGIGAAVDAAAYIDVAGVILAASLARLAFVAVRGARIVARPLMPRAILGAARGLRGAGRSVRTPAARSARQPDADGEPPARCSPGDLLQFRQRRSLAAGTTRNWCVSPV